ncbi:hypothetical protein FB566_0929 [Stackebrandtia endophytica]|uniref:Uncharacterized protein n=1 Tax=Stackebrandtia endophytica TaxID=1496996 RepID=A0A543ASE0_9ACTN|nr:DUF6389 family protein [Stackebrandtia endophytica]TQL75425.1 hypothetical protein FB566_0929 [Stackebrandtia endophytica]
MDLIEYRRLLRRILERYTDSAIGKLTAILASVPTTATGLTIVASYEDDGGGSFSVWARLEGPDSYVLNRPIEAHRELFAVLHTEDGLTPPVPAETGGESFNVPDAIADTVADWVASLRDRVPQSRWEWTVDGADGIGTTTPRLL